MKRPILKKVQQNKFFNRPKSKWQTGLNLFLHCRHDSAGAFQRNAHFWFVSKHFIRTHFHPVQRMRQLTGQCNCVNGSHASIDILISRQINRLRTEHWLCAKPSGGLAIVVVLFAIAEIKCESSGPFFFALTLLTFTAQWQADCFLLIIANSDEGFNVAPYLLGIKPSMFYTLPD